VDLNVPYGFLSAGLHKVTVDVTSGACHGVPETSRQMLFVVVLPRLPDLPVAPPGLARASGGCPDADLRPAAGRMGRVASATVCLMNGVRRSRGVRALAPQLRLRAAAIAHSLDMVRRAYFAHEAPSGPRLSTRVLVARYVTRRQRWTLGENIAAGTGGFATPRATVSAWMRSPGHRDNILNPRFRDVGVGPVLGVPGRSGSGATYTADFGRRG
jgi:hypothetical protein